MSVWVCLPSARPAEDVERFVAAWEAQGYKVFLQRDMNAPIKESIRWITKPYAGYAEAVNFLAAMALELDQECDWIVCAGDDTLPDPNKRADEIAAELTAHFNGTFGVCQPTGDSWADRQGRIIERVAGSPWLGREWCFRANKGAGPLWPAFFHMFADELLQNVAQQLGVFWQRPDLTHLHQHWGRPREGERLANIDRMPAFLRKANSTDEWHKSNKEFERLKADGFKECFPL